VTNARWTATRRLWYRVTLEQLALQFGALAQGLGRHDVGGGGAWGAQLALLTTAARCLAALLMLTKRYGHRAPVLIAAAGVGARCINHVLKVRQEGRGR
jgi:hypothetical protein